MTSGETGGDSARELNWWIAQLQSKKKDLIIGSDCARTLATPDEITYFEGNIRRLGGDPDTVDHETWIEYHDRLIEEYYDFDAEWALIKEICPELDKPAPATKRPLPSHVRRARISAVVFAVWSVVAYTALDWTATALVAMVCAMVFAGVYHNATRI